MILPYVGALKAWLYWPILQYLDLDLVSLRLPLLLTGAVTVWLTFVLLEKISGRRAAIIGALLLATDAVFVITTTYDFGPIVLLHCFLLAGLLLLLRFERTRSLGSLSVAFFLFGLALWHKALFIWMLDGLAIAGFSALHRRILPLISPARVAVAFLSLGIGASPLIYYNVVRDGATLHTSSMMSGNAPLTQKVILLRKTLDGSAMFGWLTEEETPGTVPPPRHFWEPYTLRLDRVIGFPSSNGTLFAFTAACCLVPWLWFTPQRLPAVFTLVYLAVTWGQMLIVPNTGATLHHVILLWPFPHILIAITASEVSRRFRKYGAKLIACTVVSLLVSNLMLINRYYADLILNGTTVIWTDAVIPLHKYIDSRHQPHVITVDWGYATTLCLLGDGDLHLDNISYTLLGPSEKEVAWIRDLMDDPQSLFIDHPSNGTQFFAARQNLASIAAKAGRRREVQEIILDRNRRPRFEVFHYVPVQ
jgi:hypothetical protein